jgi:hypothetical protein
MNSSRALQSKPHKALPQSHFYTDVKAARRLALQNARPFVLILNADSSAL